jgi:HK97 gp10 family phage protein
MVAKITGFEEITAQLKALGSKVGGQVLRNAAMQATLPVVQAARARAPVGNPPYKGKDPYPVKGYKGGYYVPGHAKRNIARKSVISRDKTQVNVLIGVKPQAFYAVQFIELGTSKIPKRPWLEPAFRSSLPDVQDRFRERLRTVMDKAVKGAKR